MRKKEFSMKMKITVVALCAAAAIAGCGNNFDRKINRGIALYREGKLKEGEQEIAVNILRRAARFSMKFRHVECGQNFLYLHRKGQLSVFYPESVNMALPDEWTGLAFDASSRGIAVTDGKTIRVLDHRGKVRKEFPPYDSAKGRVTGLSLNKNRLVSYRDEIVRIADLEKGEEKKPVKGAKLSPPSTGLAPGAFIAESGDRIAVCIGNIGTYSLSVIDLQKDAFLLKGKPVSSKRYYFGGDAVNYVGGTTGRWTIMRLALPQGQPETLLSFGDAVDVEIFRDGAALLKNSGLWMLNYATKAITRIPFDYSLVGRCGDNIVIHYGEAIAVADFTTFMNSVERVKKELPDLFTPPGQEKKESERK